VGLEDWTTGVIAAPVEMRHLRSPFRRQSEETASASAAVHGQECRIIVSRYLSQRVKVRVVESESLKRLLQRHFRQKNRMIRLTVFVTEVKNSGNCIQRIGDSREVKNAIAPYAARLLMPLE
jgi:hypothetical protein